MLHDKTEDVVMVKCLDVEFMGQCIHQSTSQLGEPDPFSTVLEQEQKECRNNQRIQAITVGTMDSWTIF